MAPRKVLVVGATGKQGGATIDAILALPPSDAAPPLHVLALTRDPSSARARALAAAHPDRVTLVRGDLKDAGTVLSAGDSSNSSSGDGALAPGSVDALYLFTMPGTPEDALGRAWIDAALAHGVGQVVLSTVDRGGEARSWAAPTPVPHFAQKHAYEVHLRDRVAAVAAAAGGSGAGHGNGSGNGIGIGRKVYWTVLRPTAFFDNMEPGIFCRVFAAMWSTVAPADKPLQFVSTRDVGRFAARALAAPAAWDGRAVSLAGDALTHAQARATFRRVVGRELPQTWTFLARIVFWLVPDVAKMFAWFGTDGYGADIAELRSIDPDLQDFETWLRESSKWARKDK